VLFTVKQYWVAGENNSTSSQWTSVFGLYIRGVIVSGRAQPFLVRSYRLLQHMGHLASSQPRNAVSAELFYLPASQGMLFLQNCLFTELCSFIWDSYRM
jgi:hypothetical protein